MNRAASRRRVCSACHRCSAPTTAVARSRAASRQQAHSAPSNAVARTGRAISRRRERSAWPSPLRPCEDERRASPLRGRPRTDGRRREEGGETRAGTRLLH
uniref:Uncharacterized protein n=1 Tax=Oryza glaberrima TaxID=4538 RepID=I1P328_ORYGL